MKKGMVRTPTTQDFNLFLKELDIHEKYWTAYGSRNGIDSRRAWDPTTADDFFGKMDPNNWINSAFSWSASGDGHWWWESKSRAWRQRIAKGFRRYLNKNTKII